MPSRCHLFLEKQDYMKIRSLSCSNGVDDVTVKKMLEKLLKIQAKPEEGKGEAVVAEEGEPLPSRPKYPFYMALDMERSEKELDMKKESIETILAYLSLQQDPPIRILPREPSLIHISPPSFPTKIRTLIIHPSF